MKRVFQLAAVAGLFLSSMLAHAASDSPVGTWKTIDDATGKPKSIVQIYEQNGELQAKVLQVLQSDEGPHPVCKKCEGARKDQPVEGMVIMWGVKKDGDVWDGGQILDPHNGKTYKVKLSLVDGGAKLDVHGYIGFALLGRSQVWERQD
ncbi:DUF2147 domain-containing protein [Fulvimonas soli]|jgi:uncharacterized protein (DUF2147 family)|uniref:Uncharacterized protein (DUF2147 family) n=1 Tax=Fulvimonas soli TaxID=155197 RepID=A0A316HYJ0_9GAMM|nr:DUF2147 domain-containing protein [Fulvimonas soli]PWK85232.1 uncharacterized protein (DUF2147 family) [Fulvimonas soli]TNY25196.1 hypothetical protein BV497_15145 [Fulvimonas soli]